MFASGSDILRLIILDELGGIYFDADFYALEIDPRLLKNFKYISGYNTWGKEPRL
jgi:mannosyltransferase OCH1-like enzyme